MGSCYGRLNHLLDPQTLGWTQRPAHVSIKPTLSCPLKAGVLLEKLPEPMDFNCYIWIKLFHNMYKNLQFKFKWRLNTTLYKTIAK
jgi:hypothetical protein